MSLPFFFLSTTRIYFQIVDKDSSSFLSWLVVWYKKSESMRFVNLKKKKSNSYRLLVKNQRPKQEQNRAIGCVSLKYIRCTWQKITNEATEYIEHIHNEITISSLKKTEWQKKKDRKWTRKKRERRKKWKERKW